MRRSLTFALTLFGLFDSLYLLWVYASPARPLVCLGSGCDEVRASRFSHLAGLPTPLYGVAMYGVLALLLFAEPLVANALGGRLRRAIVAIAGAGVAASAVLTAIEAFVIHAWCAWCVAHAAAIVLVFVLALTLLRARFDDHAQRRSAMWRHALVLAVAIVAGGRGFTWLQQHAQAPVEAATPPSAEDIAQRLVRPDSHATGNLQSVVTLVEFGDLQCPSCVAAEPEVRELRRRYGDRVRFVFRQFPLEQVHQYALPAAEATECAARQGKFWEALDRLYAANGDLKRESLERYAAEIGLDTARFNACLSSGETRAVIARDVADAHALGVRATPTFFLGMQRIIGAPEMAKFEQILKNEIAVLAPGPPPQAVQSARHSPEQPASRPAEKKAAGKAALPTASGGFFNVRGNSTDCTEEAPPGPEPALIHTAEAEKLVNDGALPVDVRSADDFRAGHIRGAINVPLLEAQRRVSELPRDKTLVLYEAGSGGQADVCAASRAVGRLLFGHGYKKVVVYQDGLAGWRKQSLPLSH